MAVRVTVRLNYESPRSAAEVSRTTNNDLKIGMISEEYVQQNDEGTVWNVIRVWETVEDHITYANSVVARNNAPVSTTATFVSLEEI